MRQRSTTARPSGGRFAGFEGGGEAGALLRAFNWQDSSLGPMRDWSQSLVGIVSTMLHSQQPMFLWWGPELVQCYNDAYIPSFGQGKHPASFGQAGHLCWSEIWSIISPQIRAVMSSGESCWHEDQLVPILRNGRTEDVYWTYGYSPVFDDDGAVGGTLVICTETTARILAERRVAALQRVAEQIAGAVDFATAAKMAADSLGDACPDVPFVAVFERAASGPSRLVASSGCSETLVQAVAESLRADDLHADVAPGVCREIALSGPDSPFGEPITRGAVVRTAANGEVLGALVVGVNPRLACDAAFRRFVEQIAEILALAKSKIDVHRASAAALAERNNLLLQAPIAAAVLGGPLHRFELANPHYCEMVQRSGLEGKTYLEAFPELRGTAIVSILDDVYRSGQRFVAEEHLLEVDRGQCGKLEPRFYRFVLEPLRDLAGFVYGMMAVALDITDQVAARKALECMNEERATTLTKLEAANRTKDDFLAVMGHELRNPLSPIVNALELMKLRKDTVTSDEQSIIQRQVDHLVRLVDDLVDVSRITCGKLRLRRETVEVSSVIIAGIEIASCLIHERRHQLTVDVPRVGLAVNCDPGRLGQVVSNLLTNAARYTEPGGLIEVSAMRDGAHVIISVKDSGKGISDELLPHIFDMFVQGKRSSDHQTAGLGIGLALVKSLVDMHAGTVRASSEGTDCGSEFTVRLPAPLEPAAAADRPSDVGPTPAGQSRRVMIVDDNVDAADTIGELLGTYGHEVAIVNDSLLALTIAMHFRPDVAILDIGMPVIDGYELAVQLRGQERLKACRLIALTGYAREEDRARCAQVGFSEHLVKPVNIEQLLAAVGDHPPQASGRPEKGTPTTVMTHFDGDDLPNAPTRD